MLTWAESGLPEGGMSPRYRSAISINVSSPLRGSPAAPPTSEPWRLKTPSAAGAGARAAGAGASCNPAAGGSRCCSRGRRARRRESRPRRRRQQRARRARAPCPARYTGGAGLDEARADTTLEVSVVVLHVVGAVLVAPRDLAIEPLELALEARLDGLADREHTAGLRRGRRRRRGPRGTRYRLERRSPRRYRAHLVSAAQRPVERVAAGCGAA